MTGELESWIATIPAPFDAVDEDRFGMRDRVRYGGMGSDIAEAAATVGGGAVLVPTDIMTRDNIREIRMISGQSHERAIKALRVTKRVLQTAKHFVPPPWSLVIVGSVAALALSIVLAKVIRNRRTSKAEMLQFARDNHIPDAEEFLGFATRTADTSRDRRETLAKKIAGRLGSNGLSEKRSKNLSAKLRILTAFELLDEADDDLNKEE